MVIREAGFESLIMEQCLTFNAFHVVASAKTGLTFNGVKASSEFRVQGSEGKSGLSVKS